LNETSSCLRENHAGFAKKYSTLLVFLVATFPLFFVVFFKSYTTLLSLFKCKYVNTLVGEILIPFNLRTFHQCFIFKMDGEGCMLKHVICVVPHCSKFKKVQQKKQTRKKERVKRLSLRFSHNYIH